MRKSAYIAVLCAAFMSLNVGAEEDINLKIQHQKAILQHDSLDVDALKAVGFLLLHKADYDEAIVFGERLQSIGYANHDYDNAVLYSNIILGQAYLMKGQRSAFNQLGHAQSIGERLMLDSALCSIYNGLGLYASNIEQDYYNAVQYFFKGVEAAKRCSYRKLHGILLNNLSAVYFLKGDAKGMDYALEAYELGHEMSDPYLIFCGSTTAAYMCFLRQDYEQALQYIKEAEFVMLRNDFYDQANIYAIYGRILDGKGNAAAAAEYFARALSYRATSHTSSIVFALYGYACTLEKMNRLDEAVKALLDAASHANVHNCPVHYSDVLRELSHCYELKGDYSNALKYQREYQINCDSVFNADKERSLNELRVKYDTERHLAGLRLTEMKLLKKAKNEQLLIAIIIVILTVTFFVLYLYRRKQRFFTAIVRQNSEAVRREKQLKERLAALEEGAAALSDAPPSAPAASSDTAAAATTSSTLYISDVYDAARQQKYSTSSLTGEKKEELFARLEKIMEAKIYTDNLLTKEKVAEQLGTNSTYLSQVINDRTGQSFTQYVNHYRITEAVRLLSNPANTLPLKAISAELGFNSMTTFYKHFEQAVGLTPRQYITRLRKLHSQ
jgi:AraC-like DNA-binding protein